MIVNKNAAPKPACKISPTSADHFWFAYIDPADELLEGMDVPEDVERVRITAFDDFPLFALICGEEAKAVTPYDLFEALARSRVSFETDADCRRFCLHLTSALPRYDRAMARLDKVKKVATIAAGALAVAGTALVAVHVFLTWKNK